MDDQMMRDNAFNDMLGEDYELLKFSYPHHDEFQAAVADQVHQHFVDNAAGTIKVLEGGAGSGVTTSFLLAADPRLHIDAVDSAKPMLDQAAALLNDSIDRIDLIESDLLEYIKQQPDGSFDAFVTAWTLHNLQPAYRDELFKEIYRVLRTDGLFISGDKYAVADLEQHKQQLEAQLQRFQQFPTNNQDLIKGWVEHNVEDDQIRMEESEQIVTLTSLGFKEVQTVYRQDMEAIIKGVKP